jgi:sarcosine oxidase, subunit gamma
MHDAVSALGGQVATGAVTIRDLGLRGMISLRGAHDNAALRAVATQLAAVDFPGPGLAHVQDDKGLAWMSPDEILILLPYAEVTEAMVQIAEQLAGHHHLAANVSDARAVIAVEGPGAAEALAKLAPVDLHPDAFPVGQFRRTRLGQIAAAFWREDGRFVVVCFRSVADYAFALLAQSAKDGPVGSLR